MKNYLFFPNPMFNDLAVSKNVQNVPHLKRSCFFSVCLNILAEILPLRKICINFLNNAYGRKLNELEEMFARLSHLILNHAIEWFNETTYTHIYKFLGFQFGESDDATLMMERLFDRILQPILVSYEFSKNIVFYGTASLEIPLTIFLESLDYPSYAVSISNEFDENLYIEIATVYYCQGHYVCYLPTRNLLLDDINGGSYVLSYQVLHLLMRRN